MWGWGSYAGSTYRGPERRGAERLPTALGSGDPRWRFWGRAALLAPTLGVYLSVVAIVLAGGVRLSPAVFTGLHVCWCLLSLIAGLALLLRWRMTGEAPVALLGAAFVVVALPQLPIALAALASAPDGALHRLGPPIRVVAVAPTMWLLVRSALSPAVDSSVRPGRIAVVYSAWTALVAVTIYLLQSEHLMNAVPPAVAAGIDVVIALLGLGIAWLFRCRARAWERPATTRIAAVLVGLSIAALMRVVARGGWEPMWLVSGYVGCVAMMVMVLLAVSLLRALLDFSALRMLSLSLRADSAEERVRRDQERLHEMRATIAGIRAASGTLLRHAHSLDPGRRQDLELMVTAELRRIERLLQTDQQFTEPRPALLDDIIRPLVVSHREQGATIHWQPTGTCALIRADETAEVINILLTNARQHAPEAPVDITVEDQGDVVRISVCDEGPGVAPDLAEQVFERGVRGDDSDGQGLGLHVAKRLAVEAGGMLSLILSPFDTGAQFVLLLPGVSAVRTEFSTEDVRLGRTAP